jgi:hypothetical protein
MPRIIYGCVERGGAIHSGTGFSVEHPGSGLYEITFAPAFDYPPAVVATQQYAYRDGHYRWDDFQNHGGSTKDNVVIIALNESKVRLKTGDGDGIAASRNFTFIAIGE